MNQKIGQRILEFRAKYGCGNQYWADESDRRLILGLPKRNGKRCINRVREFFKRAHETARKLDNE